MKPSAWALSSLVAVFCLLWAGAETSAFGQVPDSTQAPPIVQEVDTAQAGRIPERITPRGAFFRSALVPGWGHAKVGSYTRGAFYFAMESASALMIFKTQTRIDRTRKQLALREAVLTARLQAQGETDPISIENSIAEDPVVQDLQALQETREGQREDWIALGIFLMLIGGADAYVSAHLADFPTAVVLEPTAGGGIAVGLSLSVNF